MNLSDLIVIEGLTVHYDTHPALIDVNVTIEKNKMTAIIGPNGAGKSTFLHAMFGFVAKTSGSISFFGESFSSFKKNIAFVAQLKDVDWNFPITVYETVMMGAYGRKKLFSGYNNKDKEKGLQLLNKFGLLEKRDSLIHDLSGGERQRLFIARAYMQEAMVYVFDEPMAFVDTVTKEMILHSMKELKNEGKTVICIHHDLDVVKKTFDNAILLAHYLVDFGPVDKVLSKKNLQKAYRSNESMLTDAFLLSKEKEAGIK